MGDMKRSPLAILAAFGLLSALAPAVAQAQVIELGVPHSSLIAPTCPPGVQPVNCTIILTESTAIETIRDGVAYPTKVSKAGKIVAFTLGLSRLDSNRATAKQDIHDLDSAYRWCTAGRCTGVPMAAITVLRPTGTAAHRKWAVAAESPMVHLIPYLGQVAQFALDRPLSVKPGYVVALTVPTWAPVLSYNLAAKQFAYRQSRLSVTLPLGQGSSCKYAPGSVTSKGTQLPGAAQLTVGSTAAYGCNYAGTRVEYSATEITNATPTKNYVHAPDLP